MSKNDTGTLTYDESNAMITNVMSGRTVDRVYRTGKELTIVFTDNMEITLASDVDHDIHYLDHTVKVYMAGIGAGMVLGKVGK